MEYKELGAEYLDGKLEAKRKKYLQNELKKLGFEVSLTPIPLQQTGT